MATERQFKHMSDEAYQQLHILTGLYETFKSLAYELQEFMDAREVGQHYSTGMRDTFGIAEVTLAHIWEHIREVFCAEHGITIEEFDKHMAFICLGGWPAVKEQA